MKHLKTFDQLFESAGRDEDLREILEKIPGKDNEELGMMNYNTPNPTIVFSISDANLSFWKAISKKEDSEKVVKWITKEVDDMMFGEDEEERALCIEDLSFFRIDFNNSRLAPMNTAANKIGLKVDVGYLYTDKEEEKIEVMIRFAEDKELLHVHRGNITRKRFGQ